MTTPAASFDPVSKTSRSTILTWRAYSSPRLESVRVQLPGTRIKSYGRIIGGACEEHPAFSASYDMDTDEFGATRRLSLHTCLASSVRQLSISRDPDGNWLIQDGQSSTRSTFNGVLDIDVMLSAFFKTLPIRRLGLFRSQEDRKQGEVPTAVEVPIVYVALPELTVSEVTLLYSREADGVTITSPTSTTTVQIDDNGFILKYPDLAEQI